MFASCWDANFLHHHCGSLQVERLFRVSSNPPEGKGRVGAWNIKKSPLNPDMLSGVYAGVIWWLFDLSNRGMSTKTFESFVKMKSLSTIIHHRDEVLLPNIYGLIKQQTGKKTSACGYVLPGMGMFKFEIGAFLRSQSSMSGGNAPSFLWTLDSMKVERIFGPF